MTLTTKCDLIKL